MYYRVKSLLFADFYGNSHLNSTVYPSELKRHKENGQLTLPALMLNCEISVILLSRNIRCVENLMCLVAARLTEILIIQLLNCRVLV